MQNPAAAITSAPHFISDLSFAARFARNDTTFEASGGSAADFLVVKGASSSLNDSRLCLEQRWNNRSDKALPAQAAWSGRTRRAWT